MNEVRKVPRALAAFARSDPLAATGAGLLVLLVFVSAIGPLLPIGDPTQIGVGPRLSAPTADWPLGTDELGRSNLPRIVEAINATFLLACTAVLLTAAIGIVAGMAAGYAGGWLDMLVMRLADVLFSFPPLLLAIFMAAILGSGAGAAITAIVLVTLPLFVRVVRAVTLSVVERGFVVAAEVSGASARRILFMHVLPNVAGAAIIQLTYALSVGMLVESALSFLGLGVQPPGASLGSLLRQGAVYMIIAPWLVFPAAGILVLAIMSVNLLGDGLRDHLDPLGGRALR